MAKAFEDLKFGDYTDAVWRLVAAILLIGNHEWDKSKFDDSKGIGCSFKDQELLNKIAYLLEVEPKLVEKNISFTTKRMK